jgi:hypothetical protein
MGHGLLDDHFVLGVGIQVRVMYRRAFRAIRARCRPAALAGGYKAASCSDGTATDCTSLMRHMVIEIHWSDGGTLSN